MENSHNKEDKDNYKFNLIVIGIVGFISILSVAAFFFIHIGINATFTGGQQNIWVAFGEYFGGVLSPTLAFVALMALLYSIHYQVTEFQKSTLQLKESSSALKFQNELIQRQISEATDFRIKEAEIKKVDAANKLIFEAIICFHDLLAIKDNYRVKLTDDPVRRLACIPPIIQTDKSVEPNFFDLHYLAKISTKYKSNSPANIIYMHIIFSNYNSLMAVWKKRNTEIMPVFESAVKEYSINDSSAFLSDDDLINLIGKPKLAQLIGLTEHCITKTDDCILGFKQIFSELPDIAESQISPEVLNNYGKIFRYSWNIEESESFLKRNKVDNNKLQQFLM